MTTDTTDLLGHFAWCAQIALGIARRDKTVTTPVQEHIFLISSGLIPRRLRRC